MNGVQGLLRFAHVLTAALEMNVLRIVTLTCRGDFQFHPVLLATEMIPFLRRRGVCFPRTSASRFAHFLSHAALGYFLRKK